MNKIKGKITLSDNVAGIILSNNDDKDEMGHTLLSNKEKIKLTGVTAINAKTVNTTPITIKFILIPNTKIFHYNRRRLTSLNT
eukprot:6890405-Ditylum_brightwellii.AAC.1